MKTGKSETAETATDSEKLAVCRRAIEGGNS